MAKDRIINRIYREKDIKKIQEKIDMLMCIGGNVNAEVSPIIQLTDSCESVITLLQ